MKKQKQKQNKKKEKRKKEKRKKKKKRDREKTKLKKGIGCREMLEYVLNTATNVFCQYCPRTEKASEVEQFCGAPAKLPGRRPPVHWTGKGPVNEGVMFGELKTCSSFALGVRMGEQEWMCERMFLFTMPFLCSDSGPWRKGIVAGRCWSIC